MIVRGDEAVLVQGITGKQGSFWTERMREVGTRVVAGVSPGRGGQQVGSVPVFNSVAEAVRAHPELVASVLFTPPLATAAAVLEAIRAGLKKLVVLAEHVPTHDTMAFLTEAREQGVQVVGPNTAGVVVPGQASVGIMPGFASNIFQPGRVGVISRSGSLGTLMCLNIVEAGFGQSAFIGIGGDPIIGTTTLEALRLLDQEPRTDAVVLVGEVGGSMEEEAAKYAATMQKPVVAFIAGRTAPPGKRMGHAGAIVMGRSGSGESKVAALAAAGARVLDTPSQLGAALRDVLSAPEGSSTGDGLLDRSGARRRSADAAE